MMNELTLEEQDHPMCEDGMASKLGFPPYWVLGLLWMLGLGVGLLNMKFEAQMKEMESAENQAKKTK